MKAVTQRPTSYRIGTSFPPSSCFTHILRVTAVSSHRAFSVHSRGAFTAAFFLVSCCKAQFRPVATTNTFTNFMDAYSTQISQHVAWGSVFRSIPYRARGTLCALSDRPHQSVVR